MSLFMRAVLTTLLLCLSFLAISTFSTARDNLYIYIPLVMVFCAISFGLVWAFLLARLVHPESSPEKHKSQSPLLTDKANPPAQSIKHHKQEGVAAGSEIETEAGLHQPHPFQKTLNRAISYAKRKHECMALVIINFNVDDGVIDEKMRHEIGKKLGLQLRTEDVAATLDNDEFAILLTDINKPKFASLVAEKILKAFSSATLTTLLNPNMGISIFPNDGDTVEKLFFNAESALYKAKKSGAGKYQYHTINMDIEAREFIHITEDLQKSINNNQLSLYYQPKLDIKRGAITSVEALIRWNHPTMGILSPAQFIPIAEETGFMIEMGKWLLKEACKDNKFWQSEGYEHVTTSLNLSPIQFHHPEISSMIKHSLIDSGLSPQYLELEINEETVMGDVDLATKILKNIKEAGVRISIDHFGTGYTSVSHLKHFPINAIKIDKSYIKGIPNNPDDCAITDAFISLAHHLGFEVVAEGVETAEQLQHLSLQRCTTVQGYLLGPPLPADKISEQFNKFVDHALT